MCAVRISGTTALVSGANRGIGRSITEALLERGAAKVYAGARNPAEVAEFEDRFPGRVQPLELDVTDRAQVRKAARTAGDVKLLVNNAGVALATNLTDDTVYDQARHEMEVNYFGLLDLLLRFAPTLGGNGGGAVVNIGSVASLSNFPGFPTYSASKAAVHSLTQAARMLLGGNGITIVGVYPGPVDTRLAKDIPMEKPAPREVATAILDGLEAGRQEIFPDAFAADFGKTFHASPKAAERRIAEVIAQIAGQAEA